MTIKEFADKLNLTYINEGDLDIEVTGCYCGDLLSWVISKAKTGDAWLSVMGNVNAVAVAVLSDCACLVLTENSELDDQAKMKAQMSDVNVLQTSLNAYELAVKISGII
ncbi:MAG: DRTGG domain-containing protein [Clostridia bacterium]